MYVLTIVKFLRTKTLSRNLDAQEKIMCLVKSAEFCYDAAVALHILLHFVDLGVNACSIKSETNNKENKLNICNYNKFW